MGITLILTNKKRKQNYKNFDGLFCCSKSWKNPYFNILEKKNGKFVTSKYSKKIISRIKKSYSMGKMVKSQELPQKLILMVL